MAGSRPSGNVAPTGDVGSRGSVGLTLEDDAAGLFDRVANALLRHRRRADRVETAGAQQEILGHTERTKQRVETASRLDATAQRNARRGLEDHNTAYADDAHELADVLLGFCATRKMLQDEQAQNEIERAGIE